MGALPAHEIWEIAAAHGIRSVWVFGSRLRGDHRTDSDLDLLVEVEPGTTLLTLIKFEDAVEALLGMEVEVVTRDGLTPRFREAVLSEAKPLDVA